MYKLKAIARRSSLLGMTAAFAFASFAPVASVFAAELNPLTERSLLLSSSAPGYIDTDGSGYSTANPNPAAGGGTPATYAPAGSGPNGKKSGQTFSFRQHFANRTAHQIATHGRDDAEGAAMVAAFRNF